MRNLTVVCGTREERMVEQAGSLAGLRAAIAARFGLAIKAAFHVEVQGVALEDDYDTLELRDGDRLHVTGVES